MPTEALKDRLEALYRRWHHPQFLGTDPLLLVHEAAPADREVVAFLTSCLALGRASLIVNAGREVLRRVGAPLIPWLVEAAPGAWGPPLEGFVYRFFSAKRVAALLEATGAVLRRHGSLEAAWLSTGRSGWEALEAFAALFRSPDADLGVLLPTEGSAGAAKRLNLFLRWMVRRDGVDLGLWKSLEPAALFMPVDTHVLQWARSEALTTRATADKKACLEITQALRKLSPDDPLRYDFAITRAGMEKKGTLF